VEEKLKRTNLELMRPKVGRTGKAESSLGHGWWKQLGLNTETFRFKEKRKETSFGEAKVN
jgi:hypothetical protein